MRNQKKLFVLGMITTVALIVGGYFLWQLITPGSVEFYIQSPKQALAGETKTIKFVLENNTRLTLNEAQIKIDLPEGVFYKDNESSPVILVEEILAKEKFETEIDLMFFGQENTKHRLEANFRYKPQGFSSMFEKTQTLEVLINGSVLSLNINNPNQVLPETKFDTTVFWTNQKDISFDNLAIKIIYPIEYVFNTSDSESIRKDNLFDLGVVDGFQQGKIGLTGSMKSQGGENKKFEILLGIPKEDDQFLLIKKVDSVVSLVSNPLHLAAFVNGQSTHNASVGENVEVKVAYKNNYNVPLNNLVLKVVFEGDYFDYKKLLPNRGYFTFGNKTITWSETQIPQLATLNPGEQGEVSFTVGLLDKFNIRTLDDKNFLLRVNASLESLTPPPELSPGSRVMTSGSANVRLNADLALETEGYFKDNRTTISNCGSLPVRANEKTCFTMHWRVKNFANDVNNIVVSAELPHYVNYTNKFTASYSNPDISFDAYTKKLSWKLNNLPANSGVITRPFEIVFQIEVAPTISEIGQNVDLIKNIRVEAMDSFTQNRISKSYRELRLNEIKDIAANWNLTNVKE